MLDTLTRQRDKVLPPPDVLHERSRIYIEPVVVNGMPLELPRFNTKIASELVSIDEVTFKDGSPAGDRFRFDTITDGGIDRGVSVFRPADHIRNDYPFSILMDTAWLTGLEGHNNRIAEILMKTLGVEVVLVGPEFSAFKPNSIGAEQHLGRIAAMSTGISLMQSAESSASIYSHLRTQEEYLGLKVNVYDVGESRAAMIAQLRRIYLECFGMASVASDLTDPNLSERAFMKFTESVKLLKWLPRELAGLASVSAHKLARGEIKHLHGTVPLDPRYLTGAIVGTGPALASGEEGLGAQYTDHSHPQFTLNFKGSGAAQTDIRRMKYAHHTNSTFKEVRGCHLSLGYSSVLSHVIARALSTGEAMLTSGTKLSHEQVVSIHKAKPARPLRRRVETEEVAA